MIELLDNLKDPTDRMLLENTMDDSDIAAFLEETGLKPRHLADMLSAVSISDISNYLCFSSEDRIVNQIAYDGVVIVNCRVNYPGVRIVARDGYLSAEGAIPDGLTPDAFMDFLRVDSLTEFVFDACRPETVRLIRDASLGNNRVAQCMEKTLYAVGGALSGQAVN